LPVKSEECAAVAVLLAYVILPQDGPEGASVLRRSNGWAVEPAVESLDLPEIGMTIPLPDLYRV